MQEDLTPSLVIKDLSEKLKSFANAQLVEGCIQSQDEVSLPYPQEKIKKLLVRKCYEDVFVLLLKEVDRGSESFAISGTPGIGKSLFFLYILYRLMNDFHKKTLPLKPNRIVHQMGSEFTCFDLQRQIVSILPDLDASLAVRQQDTFYIIDGHKCVPLLSSCIVLYISLPAERFMEFVNQKMCKLWFFPLWTLDELQVCHRLCYPRLPLEILQERYRTCGGSAYYVFHPDYSIPVPKIMKRALGDSEAVSCIRNISLANMTPTTHELLRIVVSDDGPYEFLNVDIASKYVGDKLWKYHFDQMRTNLKEMFNCLPNKISRHLFEIYGHLVFSVGGRTLRCRCLESGTITEIELDSFDGKRIELGKDTIPTAKDLSENYCESNDDDFVRAIHSLSPQGMFHFTDTAENPIQLNQILRKLCKLYEEPKLYFVVPPHLFADFKKQNFIEEADTDDVNEFRVLKQYVVQLTIFQLKY